MLVAYKGQDIDRWIDQLKAAQKELGVIKQVMDEHGMPEVGLEATRAQQWIDFVSNWSINATAKARTEAAKAKARKLREAIAAKKKK
jgi:lipid A disaccharide synthetase